MFKNIGRAMAMMLGMASTHGTSRKPPVAHSMLGLKKREKRFTGYQNNKRTTAAAQRRAKIKRANKRKNPKGNK